MPCKLPGSPNKIDWCLSISRISQVCVDKCHLQLINFLLEVENYIAIVAELPTHVALFSDDNSAPLIPDRTVLQGLLNSEWTEAWCSIVKRLDYLFPRHVDTSIRRQRFISGVLTESRADDDAEATYFSSLLKYVAPLPGETGALKPSNPVAPKRPGKRPVAKGIL